MTAPIHIDSTSLLATLSTSISLNKLRDGLEACGFMLGYEPIGVKNPGLKKILDLRLPNLYAERYGEIDDICMALTVRTLEFGAIETKRVPRSATGPDFKKIFIGSRGLYGEITEAVLRIVPIPGRRKKITLAWKKAENKKKFLKDLRASGIRPAWIEQKSSRFLILHLEGLREIVRAEKQVAAALAVKTGGRRIRP